MGIFLEEKNIILAYEVIKRLDGYQISFEKVKKKKYLIFTKDLGHPGFEIFLKPEWLTFGLRLKSRGYKQKARKILGNKKFKKYNLSPVRKELHYNKWAYRNFHYSPLEWSNSSDLFKSVVQAFKDLENLVKSEAEKISQPAAQNPVNSSSAGNIK